MSRAAARKATIPLVVLIAICWVPSAASASTLYRIDFEEPTHTVGQLPAVADGRLPSRTPDAINYGTPTVVAARGAMTSQSVELDVPSSAPVYIEQLHFDTDFGEELYSIEFDLVVESALGGSAFSDGFSVHFDAGGGVRALRFRTDGTIRAFQADDSAPAIDTYALGQLLHVQARVSTITDVWSLSLDGVRVYEVLDPINGMGSMRMSVADESLSGGGSVLVDNIEIVVTPEPSTAVLFGLGLLALAALRHR